MSVVEARDLRRTYRTTTGMTHGVIAARRIAAGASLSSMSGLVTREVVIGAAYFVLAYLLFRFFEEQGRRSATLETH